MLPSRRDFLTAPFASAPAPAAAPVTPAGQFFRWRQHPAPSLDSRFWGFSIGGLVRRPLSLSAADLRRLPAVELPATIACAANPPGGERIGHAVWRGVPLAALLDSLDIAPDARYARLEALGGHVTGVSLARLRTAILAWAMNGEALSREQGGPARLIVPGLYDHKSPRWIARVELAADMPLGPWEARGWDVEGAARVTSGITWPRPVAAVRGPLTVRGYAYAGSRAIASVELSVDGGPWLPVPLASAPAYSWTCWQVPWAPPGPGDYALRVRATDSAGAAQMDGQGGTFPGGSSAIHTVVARVRREGR